MKVLLAKLTPFFRLTIGRIVRVDIEVGAVPPPGGQWTPEEGAGADAAKVRRLRSAYEQPKRRKKRKKYKMGKSERVKDC